MPLRVRCETENRKYSLLNDCSCLGPEGQRELAELHLSTWSTCGWGVGGLGPWASPAGQRGVGLCYVPPTKRVQTPASLLRGRSACIFAALSRARSVCV